MATGTAGMRTSQPVLHGWLEQASMELPAPNIPFHSSQQHWAPCPQRKERPCEIWIWGIEAFPRSCLLPLLSALQTCSTEVRVTPFLILLKETGKNLSLCQVKGVFSEVQKYHSYKCRGLFLESYSYCQLFPQVLIFQRLCHNNSEGVFPRSNLSLADRGIVLGDLKTWQVMCKWFSASHPAALFLQTLHLAQYLVLDQVSFVTIWWMGLPFLSDDKLSADSSYALKGGSSLCFSTFILYF